MFPGPFSLLNSRMLDIPSTIKDLHITSLCVAPKDIFPDYDRVMAHLIRDLRRPEDVDRSDMAKYGTSKILDMQPNNMSQDKSISIQRIHDRECREKSDSRQAAIDISNNYSRRVIGKEASERRARRPKPYRDDRRNYVKGSIDDTQSSKRCTYISPKDGHRCEKINKSPQEAGRHWRSCHLHKEAKSMLEGRLPIGKGTAITSKAQLEKIKQDIMCACGCIITRSDSMKRHLQSNCKPS